MKNRKTTKARVLGSDSDCLFISSGAYKTGICQNKFWPAYTDFDPDLFIFMLNKKQFSKGTATAIGVNNIATFNYIRIQIDYTSIFIFRPWGVVLQHL